MHGFQGYYDLTAIEQQATHPIGASATTTYIINPSRQV